VHADPLQGIDPTGRAIEPYDPDPVPITASTKGIAAHGVFSDYVLRNFGIQNAGLTLATVLPEHFSPGSPGSDLKPDAVDKNILTQTYFELKPISHLGSAYFHENDLLTQLVHYDT